MSAVAGRRATTLAQMHEIRSRCDNRDGRALGLRYLPAPSDVFIATFPKCGTTWLQQMLHMVRDPADVAVSMYHFHAGGFFEPDAIGLNEYVADTFLAGGASGTYWQFIASWWPRRAPRATIARVAQFMGLAVDDGLVDLAEERSSIRYMLAHERQFDDHLVRLLMNRSHRLPPDSVSTKVRKGQSGEGRERLSDATRARLDEAWRECVLNACGLESYQALTQQLAHAGAAPAR